MSAVVDVSWEVSRDLLQAPGCGAGPEPLARVLTTCLRTMFDKLVDAKRSIWSIGEQAKQMPVLFCLLPLPPFPTQLYHG